MNLRSSIRRQVLRLLVATVAIGLVACASPPTRPTSDDTDLQALEAAHGGRLGVFVLDTGSGRSLAWRADERFALCSTFKLLLAGLVLREHEAGRLDGDAAIGFSSADLVPYAPVIQARLDEGVTELPALELARAAQITSDNVAANLLIRRLGGPAAVTAAWRALGDPVSRLDRWEPEMNLVPPGELRDTTTPRAIAQTTAALIAGDLLTADGRETLAQWLVDTRTGLRRLRAGLPPQWRAGDKTGTAYAPGMANKYNDVAVVWPPGRAPLVIAAYYEADGHHPEMRAEDEAVLAKVGGIVAAWASAAGE